jgi:hypothetical protein
MCFSRSMQSSVYGHQRASHEHGQPLTDRFLPEGSPLAWNWTSLFADYCVLDFYSSFKKIRQVASHGMPLSSVDQWFRKSVLKECCTYDVKMWFSCSMRSSVLGHQRAFHEHGQPLMDTFWHEAPHIAWNYMLLLAEYCVLDFYSSFKKIRQVTSLYVPLSSFSCSCLIQSSVLGRQGAYQKLVHLCPASTRTIEAPPMVSRKT